MCICIVFISAAETKIDDVWAFILVYERLCNLMVQNNVNIQHFYMYLYKCHFNVNNQQLQNTMRMCHFIFLYLKIKDMPKGRLHYTNKVQ